MSWRSSRHHTRVPHTGVPLVPLVLLALAVWLLAAACVGTADEELPTNPLEVRVEEGGLEPPVAQVRAPDQYQLIVRNESDRPCTFDLATYVQGLEVAPGETGQIDVELPLVEADGSELEMGCRGDDERTGRVVVRNATGTDLGQ